MSNRHEPAIWSCDTDQQIPWFDSCQLAIRRMSNVDPIQTGGEAKVPALP